MQAQLCQSFLSSSVSMDRSVPAATPACQAGGRRDPNAPDWPRLRAPKELSADPRPVELAPGANFRSGSRSAGRQSAELRRKQTRPRESVRRAVVLPDATAHPDPARGLPARFAVLRELFGSSCPNGPLNRSLLGVFCQLAAWRCALADCPQLPLPLVLSVAPSGCQSSCAPHRCIGAPASGTDIDRKASRAFA